MSSIEEKREKRAAFMNHLYNASGGSERYFENYMVIGSAVGLEDSSDSGRWDYTAMPVPDLLSQLLEREPLMPWDRTVPEHWEKPAS